MLRELRALRTPLGGGGVDEPHLLITLQPKFLLFFLELTHIEAGFTHAATPVAPGI